MEVPLPEILTNLYQIVMMLGQAFNKQDPKLNYWRSQENETETP